MKSFSGISTLACALALAACGSSAKNGATVVTAAADHAGAMPGSGNRPRHEASAPGIAATSKILLAAAEPFEALTETAFSAGKAERAKAIKLASEAVRDIQSVVPQYVASKLNRNMAAIVAADLADHPADIALASIENYRALVSAVPGTPVVPVDVSLLDYAGFRFDADAQATPARWDDMARELNFAHQRWLSIASNVAVAKVAPRFKAALNAMDKAVQEKNAPRARAAAKVELDLVDALEAEFERAGRTKA